MEIEVFVLILEKKNVFHYAKEIYYIYILKKLIDHFPHIARICD